MSTKNKFLCILQSGMFCKLASFYTAEELSVQMNHDRMNYEMNLPVANYPPVCKVQRSNNEANFRLLISICLSVDK